MQLEMRRKRCRKERLPIISSEVCRGAGRSQERRRGTFYLSRDELINVRSGFGDAQEPLLAVVAKPEYIEAARVSN